MNTTNHTWRRSLIGAAVATSLLAGCASVPKQPEGSAAVRAKLAALQRDSELAPRAALAIKDAEAAVQQAEVPQKDLPLAAHRVYIADRKVETAVALAQRRFAEDERAAITQQGEQARLASRTLEADRAKSDALTARNESAAQQLAATAARNDADAAQQETNELKRQLELLQARPTDRGLVLTLGDTLFATGKAELKSGATANLDRLSGFLTEYPQRTAAIEGYTDSVGSEEYNIDLSRRRAETVRRYLIGQGIASNRLTADGRGENAPVGDNESPAGRQQNRRVEVIIGEAAGTAQIPAQ